MSDLIPAQPGWRVCVWSHEQDGPVELHIVAWKWEGYSNQGNVQYLEKSRLRPYVRTEFGEDVQPLPESLWYVGIMLPGETLYDWQEQAEDVAQAERDAEEIDRVREAALRITIPTDAEHIDQEAAT